MPPAEAKATGAFCRPNNVTARGATDGPLAGLSFVAKDMFDIEGSVTGNGNPDWLRTHEPATRHAWAVARLLDAGAELVGRTVCDELCYSLTGENTHYGAPLNPAAPDRVSGGSSSGSASAVAAGLTDIGLGSDCGGSIRVPASYCGLYGFRPSHGAIPLDGCAPFAPSFDCVGWMARDASTLRRAGEALLGRAPAQEPVPELPSLRLLKPREALAALEADVADALEPAFRLVEELLGPAETIDIAPEGLSAWSATFRTLQAAEIWNSLGGWIEDARPRFGPGVEERFRLAGTVTAEAVAIASSERARIVAALRRLIVPGTFLVLPTVPRIAPLKGLPVAEVEVAYRHLAMNLLCIAGLAGLPQVSLPLARHEGCPLGLSLVGAAGSDLALLGIAQRIAAPAA
ncbi:amidase [Ancylobacter sp. 3268]|uniref:amidase n=1 Tax=Ancylobacter sp. 3268 TaxID=2817752 RepID=UPI00285E938A|nr:amidase [Ancylobacter sp. 3268]MDR6951208.1 amidase [Ancylobacter sp. 3268]